MELPFILANVGYFFAVIALATKDILWLRSILIIGQVCIVAYLLMIYNFNIAFWNILLFVINSIQLVRLIIERQPIKLSAEIDDLHKNVFHIMKSREFLSFWNMGTINSIRGKNIINSGDRSNKLFLVIDGTADVIKNNNIIANLKRGDFIAEMSFLTGEPASADVKAQYDLTYIFWEHQKIKDINQINPQMYIKIQNTLSKDMAKKIKKSSDLASDLKKSFGIREN